MATEVRLPDSSFEIGTTYFAMKKRTRIACLAKKRLGTSSETSVC
jgi:hypothetical protein